jgi:hypothetical protein
MKNSGSSPIFVSPCFFLVGRGASCPVLDAVDEPLSVIRVLDCQL